MIRRAVVAMSIVVAALGSAGQAAAGNGEDTGVLGHPIPLEIDDCPARPDLTGAEVERLVGDSYDRGGVLYQQGDYAGSITEWLETYCLLAAYPIAPSDTVLKDIGQAYERMVDYDKAIAYYARYVVAIPACPASDAGCKAKAASDVQSMTARIQVLQQLPSVVQVATEPAGASVVIASEAGPQAVGKDGAPLSVIAGEYTLEVDKPGFQPIRRPIVVGIGRPYSFSFRLEPKLGRLRVQAIPGDAKISIDGRVVALGAYDGEVTLGKHEVGVEREGRVAEQRDVEVLGTVPTSIAVSLSPPQQHGHTQLIVASSAVGGLLGLSGAGSVTDNAGSAVVGLVAGSGIGGLAGYFLVPDDVTLGESSYIITTTLAGFVDGALLGSLLAGEANQVSGTDQSQSIGGGGVAGAAVGATVAVLTASRFDPSPGDAAIYNSGAVWGGVAGALFTAIFPGSSRVQTAIGLTGLNVGILTGGLLAQRYDMSRRRVVYIDLAGAAGITVGTAVSAGVESGGSGESTAHFALAGMAVGLGVGAFLTRNMDAPKLPKLTPSLTPARDAAGGQTWLLSLGGTL